MKNAYRITHDGRLVCEVAGRVSSAKVRKIARAIARHNPTLVHHGLTKGAAFHLTSTLSGPIADVYVSSPMVARAIAQLVSNGLNEQVEVTRNTLVGKGSVHSRVDTRRPRGHSTMPSRNPAGDPRPGEVWTALDGGKFRVVSATSSSVQALNLDTGNRERIPRADFMATMRPPRTRPNPSGPRLPGEFRGVGGSARVFKSDRGRWWVEWSAPEDDPEGWDDGGLREVASRRAGAAFARAWVDGKGLGAAMQAAGGPARNPRGPRRNPKGRKWVLATTREDYGRVFISTRRTTSGAENEMFTTDINEAKRWPTKRAATAAAKHANSGVWAFGWKWRAVADDQLRDFLPGPNPKGRKRSRRAKRNPVDDGYIPGGGKLAADGWVEMTSAQWNTIHRDYKGHAESWTEFGKMYGAGTPSVMGRAPGHQGGGSVLYPVRIIDAVRGGRTSSYPGPKGRAFKRAERKQRNPKWVPGDRFKLTLPITTFERREYPRGATGTVTGGNDRGGDLYAVFDSTPYVPPTAISVRWVEKIGPTPNPSGRKRSRGVRGNPSSELERAKRTAEMWNEFPATGGRRVKVRSRTIPQHLVKLGDLDSVVYRSKKYGGKPKLYEHRFKRPLPVLTSDPDGRAMHIVGGGYKITGDGIVD